MPDIQGFDSGDPPVHIRIEDVQLAQPRLVYEGEKQRVFLRVQVKEKFGS